MKYSFKEMLDAEIYASTKVMFIFGKYSIFNNMVSDTLKEMCNKDDTIALTSTIGVNEEFGFGENNENQVSGTSNSIDFNTFMEVIGVASITGKWFCKVDLSMLSKKQKEILIKYIKEPSDNGILVVTSIEWKDYREYLKNRVISYSKYVHVMQLNFPNRLVLRTIVQQMFEMQGIEIDNKGADLFISKMNTAYEDYEAQILETISKKYKRENKAGLSEQASSSKMTDSEIKDYMKDIENFVLDDFVEEITKPLTTLKTTNKKVFRIMMALQDEIGAKNLVYQLINKINEYIEFRILINKGYIPIGIKYFYKDVINSLGEESKYQKMNEWIFRKKADIASRTSLKDWEYMKLILSKAIENNRVADSVMDLKCKKAIYEVVTRSILSEDRINNIISIDNMIKHDMNTINKIQYVNSK